MEAWCLHHMLRSCGGERIYLSAQITISQSHCLRPQQPRLSEHSISLCCFPKSNQDIQLQLKAPWEFSQEVTPPPLWIQPLVEYRGFQQRSSQACSRFLRTHAVFFLFFTPIFCLFYLHLTILNTQNLNIIGAKIPLAGLSAVLLVEGLQLFIVWSVWGLIFDLQGGDNQQTGGVCPM